MLFQNYEVLPLGNANLTVTPQGILFINNIGNTGYDGVMINVIGHGDYEIQFNEIPAISQGGVMQITTKGKNLLNQTTTISEKVTWFDPLTNLVYFGYNVNLLPKQYLLKGKLNGNTVFEFTENNPIYEDLPQVPIIAIIGLCVAAASLGVGIYNALKTHHYRIVAPHYNLNHDLIGYSVVQWDDPIPFEITVHDQNYIVDEFGIEYDVNFPTPVDPIYAISDSSVYITGYNLNSFEITSII